MGMTVLASCGLFNPPEEKPQEPENLIYGDDTDLYLIWGEDVEEDVLVDFSNTLDELRGVTTKYADKSSESHAHEIVLGNTDREISVTAKSRLDRIEKNNDDIAYLIYSDGDSVAIVASDDKDGLAMKLAIEYFFENLATGTELTIASGVVTQRALDPIDDYYLVVDEEYKNKMWASLAERVGGGKVGDDFVVAMKQLYSLYTDGVVLWLANLYEPSICVCNGLYGLEECEGHALCGTAAFYYSNSARDTLGFLPDVETTFQALGFLNSTGMSRLSGGYQYMLDEDIKDKIAAFVLNLQDEETGYFRHPQWPNAGTSRLSRDLSWAMNILSAFGLRQYYTTPTGVQGTGKPSASSLKSKLGTSVASLVSSVSAVDSTPLGNLKDRESFEAYLATFDLSTGSYGAGNTLVSLTPQIMARDSQLKNEGADYSLMDIMIDWLNEHQSSVTGYWDTRVKGDKGYTEYIGVNGLMKISGIYNYAKIPVPNAEAAINSAIKTITAEEKVTAAVDVYNPWHALTVLFNNLKDYGDENDAELVEKKCAELYANASKNLLATREKIADFQKEDGSFSYTPRASSSTSQGCAAAVPNTNEGDVNGTILSCSGLLDYVYSGMCLRDVKVPIFGESYRLLFMNELRSLSPSRKPTESLTPSTVDFEKMPLGAIPEDDEFVSAATYPAESSINVVEREDGKGKAVLIDSYRSNVSGDSVNVQCSTLSATATTFVFEGEFCVLDSDIAKSTQIFIGSPNATTYMCTLQVDRQAGKVSIWENSSGTASKSVDTVLCDSLSLGEWFKIKIEYYYGDKDNVRIKFYLDDNIYDGEAERLIAVTDNFYDRDGNKLSGGGTPSKEFARVQIYTLSSAVTSLMVDNVSVYHSKTPYSPVTDPENQPKINVDSPDTDEKKYDFSTAEPTDMIISGNAVIDEEELWISGGATVNVPINVRTKSARCASVSFDIKCESAPIGLFATLTLGEGAGNIISLQFLAAEESGEKYVLLRGFNGSAGEELSGVKIPLGESVTLRIDYYHDEDNCLVYLDGVFVGASDYLYNGGERLTARELTLKFEQKNIALSIDNVVAERIVKSYTSATSPNKPSVIYDFEDGVKDATLSGSAVVVNRALKIDSSSSYGKITVPVLQRSDIYSLITLEADLKFASYTVNGEAFRIKLSDADESDIAAFAIRIDGAKAELYDIGVRGLGGAPLCTFNSSETNSLAIRIFPAERMIEVYLGGVCVAKTGIFAHPDNRELTPKFLTIVSTTVRSALILDNIKAETVYEAYSDKAVTGAENSESGTLTFESSSTGSLPSHLISTTVSNGSSLKIEEMINNTSGEDEYSRVAVHETYEGNNDRIGISAEEDLTKYSAIVFEADIKIDSKSGGLTYQFYLSSSNQEAANVAYCIYFSVNGGKLSLQDMSNTSGSTSRSCVITDAIYNANEWNRIKIEYFKGDKDSVRTRVSINGEVIYVGDNYFGYNRETDTHTEPKNDIKNAFFYSMFAAKSIICVDNISISGTNDTCEDPVSNK